MLTEDLHDTTLDAEVDIDLFDARHPFLAAHFIDRIETVRGGLVGAKYTKVCRAEIQLHDIAQKASQDARRFSFGGAGLRRRNGVIAEVRHS